MTDVFVPQVHTDDVPLGSSLARWAQAWRAGEALGGRVDRELEFSSLLDLLPVGPTEAVNAPTGSGRRGLTFSDLREFLTSPELTPLAVGIGERCAIALPEGPELAVCLLAVSSRCVAVPMNPWSPEGELATDLSDVGAKAVIVATGPDFDHVRRAARARSVTVIELIPDVDVAGMFRLVGEVGETVPNALNEPTDVALQLFTSGTSGRKKQVSMTLQNLAVGAACIAAALELDGNDRGYNMMPLFHVGGIARNLFAPMLAGTPMVYSDGFDPSMFWDELGSSAGFTWYYASPTMHQGVLAEGARRPEIDRPLRFICNAAGELLPSTAAAMRARFGGTILPGYGMTECMPIAIPPLDYQLDRKGASGRILGPEVAIVDEHGNTPPQGVAGRIILRGAPVAHITGATGDEPGLPAGWFDTGDLGRFDDDGFLYIVGRGKDVIKRGGETIAPGEIEDVLVGHEEIAAALAFSVPHDTLVETVGAVIVPRGNRRVDLESLAPYLAAKLSPAKWPTVLVYMDDLPKNHTSKVLRVGLATRLGIEAIDDRAPAHTRLREALCPPKGTPLTQSIPSMAVIVTSAMVDEAVRTVEGVADVAVRSEVDGHPTAVVVTGDASPDEIRFALRTRSHDYVVPRTIVHVEEFPRTPSGAINWDAVDAQAAGAAAADLESDEVTSFIASQWRAALGEGRPFGPDSDFFDDLGGGSLTAVQVIAILRKHYRIALPPTAIFRARTIARLAEVVRRGVAEREARGLEAVADSARFERDELPAARSSRRPAALLVQALPLMALPPLARVFQLVMLVIVWWAARAHLGLRGMEALALAVIAVAVLRGVALPLSAVAAKWVLVGRFRAGDHALWGGYYLRWWLARQIQQTFGLGVFAATFPLTATYYRLMGATVGRHTLIEPSADLGEFDLLRIGDGASIDESAIVRPFYLDQGAMRLDPIELGAGVSVGIRSTIAPGTILPAGTEIAPLGTSDNPKSWNQGTRGLSRAHAYAPPNTLKALGMAIKTAILTISWLPTIVLTHYLVLGPGSSLGLHGPADLLHRMMLNQRLVAGAGIAMLSAVAAPFLYLACVIVVKWTIVGRFRAGTDVHRAWPMFERWLMWRLLPDGRLGGVAPLLGSNFSGVSVVYRLLGAKVGKRIYWSGSGHVLVEYDLFECGDDATFGSRSTYLMTSEEGSWPIKIEAGANVADRCVLAPGVMVGTNAVLGSGTYAPSGFSAPAGSTWIGQDGRVSPIEFEAATPRRAAAPTLRPYGRAMHLGEATYAVWSLARHIAFNLAWAAFKGLYTAAPMLAALLVTRLIIGDSLRASAGHAFLIALVVFVSLVPLQLVSAIGAMGISIWSKWALIGHREGGEHFWTDSAYCQRWKIQKVIASITSGWSAGRDVVDFLQGSEYLVWFFRAEGARIGRHVCLYPNGADPMMEEADLLSIGDGAAIDQAVLIAHLNTRGEWTTGPITMGDRVTLRASSRVMMLSSVGDDATILEGSLVLAGDDAGAATVWRGWPAQEVGAYCGPPVVLFRD